MHPEDLDEQIVEGVRVNYGAITSEISALQSFGFAGRGERVESRSKRGFLPVALDRSTQPFHQQPEISLRQRAVVGMVPDQIPRLDGRRLARRAEQRGKVAQALEDGGRGDAARLLRARATLRRLVVVVRRAQLGRRRDGVAARLVVVVRVAVQVTAARLFYPVSLQW